MQLLSTPAALLFDLDGTLVNSEPLKGLALAKTCTLYAGQVSAEQYMAVMGEDWPTVTTHFFRSAGIQPEYAEFNQQFQQCYLALLEQNVALTEGATPFLRLAQERAIRLAVVSSAAPWMVEKILSQLQIQDYFELVITQAHVTKHKPDPEAYLKALSLLRLEPDEVLVFEDSQAGLLAATRAGCPSIAIRHHFNARHDLSAALQVIPDFTQLLN